MISVRQWIVFFDRTGNRMGEAGATSLGEGLRTNSTLKKLNVSCMKKQRFPLKEFCFTVIVLHFTRNN